MQSDVLILLRYFRKTLPHECVARGVSQDNDVGPLSLSFRMVPFSVALKSKRNALGMLLHSFKKISKTRLFYGMLLKKRKK